jgi:hypothetical protein
LWKIPGIRKTELKSREHLSAKDKLQDETTKKEGRDRLTCTFDILAKHPTSG